MESRRLSRDAGKVISPRVSGEWEGGGVVLRLHIASVCTGEKIEATLTRYWSGVAAWMRGYLAGKRENNFKQIL